MFVSTAGIVKERMAGNEKDVAPSRGPTARKYVVLGPSVACVHSELI